MGANQFSPVRKIRIVGSIAYVPLTRGFEAIVDAPDAPLLEGFNWCARGKGDLVYAARGGYDPATKRTGTIYMHRVLLAPCGGSLVDHINGDGLDNRRCNLRLTDHKGNGRNCKNPRHNTSGFKGVSFKAREGSWAAQIKVDKQKVYLGSFRDPELAYAAYCEASDRLHGKFGRVK